MGDTTIQWTEKVWNPITGCTKISAGCQHCYAERMAHRLAGRYGYPAAPDQFKVTLHPDKLNEPLRWRKPKRIFVDSMGDLFHKDVPFEFIDLVFYTMFRTTWHTYQVLTKRPDRMLEWARSSEIHGELGRRFKLPAINIWLGVSAENQATADERIPFLLQTPAAVRFVSVEPMLGAIDLSPYLTCEWIKGPEVEWRKGTIHGVADPPKRHAARLWPRLDWVIVGCESGPKARPTDIEWIRNLRNQCVSKHDGIRFFLKQLVIDGKLVKMPELDGRQWAEMPQ